jgi:hypothetical protein
MQVIAKNGLKIEDDDDSITRVEASETESPDRILSQQSDLGSKTFRDAEGGKLIVHAGLSRYVEE